MTKTLGTVFDEEDLLGALEGELGKDIVDPELPEIKPGEKDEEESDDDGELGEEPEDEEDCSLDDDDEDNDKELPAN